MEGAKAAKEMAGPMADKVKEGIKKTGPIVAEQAKETVPKIIDRAKDAASNIKPKDAI